MLSRYHPLFALQATDGFQSTAGTQSLYRCIVKRIKPCTIAAGSGVLAVLTPMAFNTSTNLWQTWNPNAGTTQALILTASGTVSGGTYTITINNETTAAIAYNANNAAILAAVQALGGIDPADVQVAGGAFPGASVGIFLQGQFTKKALTNISVNAGSITGGGTIVTNSGTVTPPANWPGGTTAVGTQAGVDSNDVETIRAFVWPHPITLNASGEVIGNLTLEAEIHIDEIPLVGGATLGQLQTALAFGVRSRGFYIQGLSTFR